MRLSEFLNYFDFDYKIVDGQMRFVDLQGANLGDIEEERWCLGEHFFEGIVDRMHIYINDYILRDLEEELIDAGVENAWELNLADLVKEADARDIWYDKEIVAALLDPSVLELDQEKLVESFSVGQILYEKDTKKFIVLDKLSAESHGIWSFKVCDQDMQYLYDTSAMDLRLARDIMNGVIVSVTHEKVLRLQEDGMRAVSLNNGTIAGWVEMNDFFQARFDDVLSVPHREISCANAKYDFNNDTLRFELQVHDLVDTSGVYNRQEIVVEGTAEDKAMLLLQLKGLEPEFFEKFKKPALCEAISAAEEQKGFCTPGFDFKIDKEGNAR